ncbi:MAG: hypothetical protein ABEJ04_02460 [Halobacteriaceae archaeon]
MSASDVARRARRVAPTGEPGRWLWALAAQALVLGAYVATIDGAVTAPRYLLYPFVWINASAWALLHASPAPGSRRHRLLAGGVAAGYLLAMLAVAGFVGPGSEAMTGWRIVAAPPGWGPMVAYQGAFLRLYLVPFQVLGYATLAYLLYAVALDATRGVVSGALGLVSCVGCTWTVVAPLLAGTVGGVSALGATVYALSYDLTTGVFLATVALLYASHRGWFR